MPNSDERDSPQEIEPMLNKRLLHVIHSIRPAAGGPTEGIRKLAEACAGGDWMELVCLDDPAEPFVRGYAFPVHAVGPSRGHYGYTSRLKAWLNPNLSRFDGVVIHGLWQYHSYGAYEVVRGRSPYVIFPHGMLDPYFKRAFPLKHLRKQMYWLSREHRVLRDAKAVCFTTPIERDCSVHTMWPHRWNPAVVSFGTSAPSGNASEQRERFLAEFPQLAGRRFFLFLSRIHTKKGCDLAIEAFARVAPQHPELDLVIAGPDEGALRPKLQAQAQALKIEHRVHWTGMLEGDLKWGAIHAAAAFVLPSHQENFGIAAVEALAAGLPVLLSNKVNIWPDIVEDRAGIINDDTAEGTYRSMTEFLNMPREESQRMAQNGVRCFRSRFEMKRTAKTLNDLF
ncbi:MAG TPA: glycosyltransferase [Acidobacteriaceae bacterium]|nr:glycosyltransferase [Acidobacteriaceae bacterium]